MTSPSHDIADTEGENLACPTVALAHLVAAIISIFAKQFLGDGLSLRLSPPIFENVFGCETIQILCGDKVPRGLIGLGDVVTEMEKPSTGRMRHSFLLMSVISNQRVKRSDPLTRALSACLAKGIGAFSVEPLAPNGVNGNPADLGFEKRMSASAADIASAANFGFEVKPSGYRDVTRRAPLISASTITLASTGDKASASDIDFGPF